jgi:hypothetical protein
MDTDKLLKAIQILVEAEVKKQLPKIIAEINSNEKKAIVEKVIQTRKSKQSPSMAKAILGNSYNKPKQSEVVQYTKNSMINDILNETKNSTSYNGTPVETGFEEYPTMRNSIPTPTSTPDANVLRSQMAAKMGYGDMVSGLGVKTGNDALDKALNRNYSELVKRF